MPIPVSRCRTTSKGWAAGTFVGEVSPAIKLSRILGVQCICKFIPNIPGTVHRLEHSWRSPSRAHRDNPAMLLWCTFLRGPACKTGYSLPAMQEKFGLKSGFRVHRKSRVQLLFYFVQGGWGGWPTGNGKKLSNSQACCLA